MKAKELLKLVKKNPNRGSSWKEVKGNRAPGSRQIQLLRKYKIVLDIDPKIRNLIIDLNEDGFKTTGSCAGHIEGAFGSANNGGFVISHKHKTISYADSQKLIKKLCRKYGINKVVFDDSKAYACANGTNMFCFHFKSLGNFAR